MRSAAPGISGPFPPATTAIGTDVPDRGRRAGGANRNVPRDTGRRCAPFGTGCDRVGRRDRRRVRETRPHHRSYPSDLTDGQWQSVRILLKTESGPVRPGSTDLRAVLNAINYRWRCGCTWRMLPHDFPPWETVYGYFRSWRKSGILPVIRDALLCRHVLEPRRQRNVDSR